MGAYFFKESIHHIEYNKRQQSCHTEIGQDKQMEGMEPKGRNKF